MKIPFVYSLFSIAKEILSYKQAKSDISSGVMFSNTNYQRESQKTLRNLKTPLYITLSRILENAGKIATVVYFVNISCSPDLRRPYVLF